MTAPENRSDPRPLLSARRVWPLIVLAVGLGAVFALDFDVFMTLDAVRENRVDLTRYVGQNGMLSALGFVMIYIVCSAIGMPGMVVLTLAGGFLFGAVLATLLIVVGATTGATILFLAAKMGLGDALLARSGPAVRKMEANFKDNELSYLFVLRLIPLFPFSLVNIVPAFFGVKLRNFVLATAVGIVPVTFIYASLGEGLGYWFDSGRAPDLRLILDPKFALPIAGLVVLALLSAVYKRFKAGKAS